MIQDRHWLAHEEPAATVQWNNTCAALATWALLPAASGCGSGAIANARLLPSRLAVAKGFQSLVRVLVLAKSLGKTVS